MFFVLIWLLCTGFVVSSSSSTLCSVNFTVPSLPGSIRVCVGGGAFVVCVDGFTLAVILLWWFLIHRSAAQIAQESLVELEHPPGQQEGQGYEHCLGAVQQYEGVPCPCLVEYCKYAK